MTTIPVQAGFTRRLTHKPVRHECGHFEARLMGFDIDPNLGYAVAGSPCSECAPQGRPVQPNYSTPEAVAAACAALDAATGRTPAPFEHSASPAHLPYCSRCAAALDAD